MIDAVTVTRDGPVTTVVLNRPQRRNAVDGPTAAALAHAFRAFDADPDAAVGSCTEGAAPSAPEPTFSRSAARTAIAWSPTATARWGRRG